MEQIKAIDQYLRETPYGDPMDDTYKRLVYVRYADDFLIGVIGSKDDARQVKADVGTFIQEQLLWSCQQEKTAYHARKRLRALPQLRHHHPDGANSTRTKGADTKRSYTGASSIYVPKEKW